MLSILIVDDERRARNGLKILIQQNLPGDHIISEASSADEASKVIEHNAIDLVFLDIEMPVTNGIDWLQNQVPRTFEVIFTTAYNEYTIQAIRLAALDYLLKPIVQEELIEAFNRFWERKKLKVDPTLMLQSLVENLNEKKKPKISIPTTGGYIFFNVDQIIHCEADNNYTIFYLSGNKKHIASRTLKEYDELLTPYSFLRVHQSHLVNLKFITEYIKGMLLLEEGHHVPVSRRRHSWIIDKLKQDNFLN